MCGVSEMRCAHVNVRLLLSKVQQLVQRILLHRTDIFAVTETWLTRDVSDRDIQIRGFVCVRSDRSGKGGGVAFYV